MYILLKMRVAQAALLALVWIVVGENCRAAQTVAAPAVSVESAAADCHEPGVSAAGQLVVFISQADNLVPTDHNGMFDVFVRDRTLGKTILVSVDRDGTRSGNGHSLAASLSADGRFVAFESSASDLVLNDTNNASDIFVRDLVGRTTALVSVSIDSVSPGNQASSWPVMTPDGRFILFESRASNLDRNDLNGASDLFVRDMISGVTALVTRDRFGTASATGGGPAFSDTAQISDDGRRVAFSSSATNLVVNDKNQRTDVFVRDLLNRTNILLSVATNGIPANNHSSHPVMSADGRYVAFQSPANNLVVNNLLVTNNVYVRDLISGTTILVSVNQSGGFNPTSSSFGPAISADGRYVAFQSFANDLVAGDNAPANQVPALDVFVRDLQSGTTIRVSTNSVVAVGDDSFERMFWTTALRDEGALPTSISRDGRFIAYQSDGRDITNQYEINQGGTTTNRFTDNFLLGTFIYDQQTGTRSHISGAQFPSLSEDGRFVAFQGLSQDHFPGDSSANMNIFARDLASGLTELISRRDTAVESLTGNAMSQLTAGSISASGRFVTYESFASDLSPGDTNRTSDVFVRDLITGSNEWISANYRTDIINPGGTSFSNVLVSLVPSRLPVISGDARWVAFEALVRTEVATNGLSPPLTNGLNYQFTLCAYDRIARTNLLVASVGPTNKPGPPSTPAWNSDGRYLAFQSSSPDPGMPAVGQIYYRDMTQETNVLVTLNHLGSAGVKPSWNPLIDADGAHVLFLNSGPDLVTNVVSGTNLFLWDAATRSNTLVSVSTNGDGLNRVSQAALSADGRFATFLNQANLYLFDLTLQSLSLVATNASADSLSADGRFIAFESKDALAGSDTNLFSDIFIYDRNSNTLVLASVKLDGTTSGNGKSTSPLVTPDGRHVIFTSQASDLVANDSNRFADVFLRDVAAGTTMLLSVNFNGAGSGNRLSANPVLSADGNVVIFESHSSDLSIEDFNTAKDIFVFRLGLGDSDGDGLGDDWEMAYFGNLSREGSGDFDGDGATDLEEFGAGTSPTNDSSILRAFVLTSTDGSVSVLWSAVSGRVYRVQYKERMADASWTDLAGDVVAVTSTSTKPDPGALFEAQRYYRVLALPQER
jgi:Tol biopolymer transport system component